MDIGEVLKRLQIDNKDIVENTYAICYDLVKQEEERRERLDTKTSNLIGIVGVFITLVFGFGGIILEKVRDQHWATILVGIFLGAIFCGAVSLWFALTAVKAKHNLNVINDEDIFNKEMLKGNIIDYKRYLIAHFWRIYRNNFKANEEKGKYLVRAFKWFSAAVIFLFVIVLSLSVYIISLKGGV